MDDDAIKLLKEQNKLLREEIQLRKKAENPTGKITGMLSSFIPKGIRHPDSMIKNKDWYLPRRRK